MCARVRTSSRELRRLRVCVLFNRPLLSLSSPVQSSLILMKQWQLQPVTICSYYCSITTSLCLISALSFQITPFLSTHSGNCFFFVILAMYAHTPKCKNALCTNTMLIWWMWPKLALSVEVNTSSQQPVIARKFHISFKASEAHCIDAVIYPLFVKPVLAVWSRRWA